MNLSLQDPFAVAQEYPESLSNTLTTGHLVVIQFSKKGDYLASGLVDGLIVIYDLTCNGSVIVHIKKKLHIRPVTSLSWSTCGRYLLSTSQDWTCKLWDLLKVNSSKSSVGDGSEALIHTTRLDGPIWMGAINPHNHREFVVAVYEDDPVYIKLNESGAMSSITKLQTRPLGEGDDQINDTESIKKESKHLTLVTVFYGGNFIFAGTSKGWLNIIDLNLLKTVKSVKIANGNIKNIVYLPKGAKLAINSSDRIIRQIQLPGNDHEVLVADIQEWDFEEEHRYQDVVNRLQWNSVTFNHNGEFLVALTYGHSLQDLYVWETSMGSLVKILEGSHEELIDVKWNYNKCMIGSTGIDSGYVYLWLVQFPQKWSALAPDFVEVEENIEYDEKEDEFDELDDEEMKERLEQEEDVDVDIITKEPFDARGFKTDESFVIPVKYF